MTSSTFELNDDGPFIHQLLKKAPCNLCALCVSVVKYGFKRIVQHIYAERWGLDITKRKKTMLTTLSN